MIDRQTRDSCSKSRLILASGSPRRRQLLQTAGYRFDVMVPSPHIESQARRDESQARRDESQARRDFPAIELVQWLARQKAANVASHVESGLILAADTVAECDGQILGKPSDLDDARRMLWLLRGREHRVITGLCLWRIRDASVRIAYDVTWLRMQPLSDAVIEAYLETDLWSGKAGAFGYQDGNDWVRIVAGSESNVVGLPLDLLSDAHSRSKSVQRG